MARGSKERTWPYTICVDPTDRSLFNVTGLNCVVIFTPGVERRIAKQAYDALNTAFDWAREVASG